MYNLNAGHYFEKIKGALIMNLQEFKMKKPEFVKEASKCKDEFEFTRLAEKYGIKFGTGCFEKAYALFCGKGEISEDALASVAGGVNLSATEIGIGSAPTTIVTL